MENIKYIDISDEELSSMLETKEEMMESIKAALASPSLPKDIKDHIEKNYKMNPNPNSKEYLRFVLGLLNSNNDDFKITIKTIILFTSEENISTLIKKKLARSEFVKNDLERLAGNIQFGLDCYDNKEKYFNRYIKSMVIFIINAFNEKLLPFIINKIGIEKDFLNNLTLEQYEQKENKDKLMKFWKKIYYYICKAFDIKLEEDLIRLF